MTLHDDELAFWPQYTAVIILDMGELKLGHHPPDAEEPWWGEYLSQYKQTLRHVRGARVLDIGCGQGYGSRFLFDNGAVEVVGVDFNSADILKAQEHHGREGVAFVVEDAKKLSFADGSFDVITCFQLFESTVSTDQVLAQIARLLNPQGIAIISTVNRKRFSQLTEAPAEPNHMQEFDHSELKRLLKIHFNTFDLQGLFCTRLSGTNLLSTESTALEFLRQQFESRVPWGLKNSLTRKIFGVSYYPDENEYVLRSMGVDEAPLFFATCRK